MSSKIVFLMVMMLVCVLGGTSRSWAELRTSDACDTAAEYKKMVKYLTSQPDESSQALTYAKKKLKKYGRMSLSEKMQNEQYKKDLAKALSEFRPAKAPKFACQKIPGNKLVVEKSGMFSGVACVRATRWKSCKWTGYKVLRINWAAGSDRKNWIRK